MYIKYLRYVIIHKWFVMVECFRHGIYWRGLTHDLSKFKPDEFIPYARYFYGNLIDEGEEEKMLRLGIVPPRSMIKRLINDDFDFAWLLHQKRNRHHWQWWILPLDDGGNKILEMLPKYRIEMICDWLGAGRAISGRKECRSWYEKNKGNMILHPKTREWVEYYLG